MAGQPVAQIKKQHMHLHQMYSIMTPDGKIAATIRKKIMSLKPKITVYQGEFKDKKTSPVLLEMNGSITGRNFQFVDSTGKAVAKTHEKRSNLSGIVFGQDEYVLEVAPGIDVTFVVACILAMDNMQERK